MSGKLTKIAAAAFCSGLGLALAGCANNPAKLDPSACIDVSQNDYLVFNSMSKTYNRTCDINKAAQKLATSDDIGVRAVGLGVLAKTNPEVRQEVDRVKMEMKPEKDRTYECTASETVKNADGTQRVKLDNCVHPM